MKTDSQSKKAWAFMCFSLDKIIIIKRFHFTYMSKILRVFFFSFIYQLFIIPYVIYWNLVFVSQNSCVE